MKKLMTLLTVMGLFMSLHAQQDTARSLIFTEWRGESWGNAYIELTNVGDDTLDLSRFTLFSMPPRADYAEAPANARLRLTLDWLQPGHSGKLAPGEVFVSIPITEEINAAGNATYRTQVEPFADLLAFKGESGVKDLPYDSISPYERLFRLWGTYPSGLFYHLDNGDSVLVDAVNNGVQEGGQIGGFLWPVAGVPEATDNNILVRKASVVKGNTNWANSRGIDQTDSEWIVIPQDASGIGMPFTTLGTHGNFPLSYSSTVVGIVGNKITVPWGIWKGDTLVTQFALGDGMAWEYIEDDEWIDSTHVVCQPGDKLIFLACGNNVEIDTLEIEVAAPTGNMVRVFPKRRQNEELNWTLPYYVTEKEPVMDTIGDVPFACRVDSLFKYLEKAENAKWEIVFTDQSRPDLKNGDILKVTGGDNTTIKEYYIDVMDYEGSHNAMLSAITWPDMPGWISDDWMGDTIPGFNPAAYSYKVLLPIGTTNVPALVAMAQDINASIKSTPAVSLKGGLEERTSHFIVTAEDDTTILDYSITFEVEKDISKSQPYQPEPFFAEFVARHNAGNNFIEIVNSGNRDLNMSQYMILQSKTTRNPADAIKEFALASQTGFNNRYRKYVPGFKFTNDTTVWKDNVAALEYDLSVEPMVAPGDVFVMMKAHKLSKLAYNYYEADVVLAPSAANADEGHPAVNPWDADVSGNNTAAEAFDDFHFLFRIDNDSVFNGSKGLVDPNDFTLIDIFADPINNYWNIAGRNPDGAKNWGKNLNVYRKSYVDSGVETPGEDWGTNMDDTDWVVRKSGEDVENADDLLDNVGFHTMDPVTKYMSTVSSLAYIVSDGYSMEETIRGVVTATSVDQFYGNITKADEEQTLAVKSKDDGSDKIGAAELVNGDTLVVTSKDMENVTKYILEVTAGGLNSDAELKAKDGSGYTVEYTGANGSISGFPYLITVQTVLENVEKPESAILNVIDSEGNLVPMQQLNSDMVMVQTQVSDNIIFQVIAENGTTVIHYQLMPTSLSSDAFVISNVYLVDQVIPDISNIPDQTSVSGLLTNLEAVTGAKMMIIDKQGFDRELGMVSYDDKLMVVSEDETNAVEYFLTFFNEMNPDVPNQAPLVSVAFSDTTINPNITIMLKSSAVDDDLPDPPGKLSYQWTVTSGEAANVTIATPDQLNTDITISQNGLYDLTITADDSELSSSQTVRVAVYTVGFEMFDMKSIKVYPNPAREMVYVDFGMNLNASAELKIVDLTGKVAYLGKHFNDQVEIDVNSLDPGIYFMIIKVDDQSLITKLNIVK